MKKFISRILLFILLAASVTALYYFVLMKAQINTNVHFLADEVLYVIDKADIANNSKTVIVGDSVANQLWPQTKGSEDCCYLTSNQAITTAGSYILLYHYLEANPQTERVYYSIRPQGLSNDINIDKSFQYFVIPFSNKYNWDLLDSDTTDKLSSRFGSFMVNNKYPQWIILNNNFLMEQYLTAVEKKNPDLKINDDNTENRYYHRISPTGQIYLSKMIELCNRKNVELIVVPSPLMDVEDNYGWEAYSEDIINMGFEETLGNFINSIDYYPEDMFMDGIHFSESTLNDCREEIAEKVIPQ